MPEVPGPPLFNPDEIQTNSQNMALAVLGGSLSPVSGPLVAAATLYAGEQAKVWTLEGIMTNSYSRWSLGAGTLVAGGFGGSPLGQFGILKAGQSFDCWALFDTDKFVPLPESWLKVVSDGSRVANGGSESVIYGRVLLRSFFGSPAAFKSALREDITYAHLLDDPVRYRGEVVRVEGRLLRINTFAPPHEVEFAGCSAVYEAWIFNEVFGASPFCVVFTHWPDDLPRSYLGQAKLNQIVRVRADGYFFKTFKYKASDKNKTERDAPLVVSYSLWYEKPDTTPPDPGSWVRTLLYTFVGLFGALLVGVFGLTFWYRRNDTSVRRRLMARTPEFVLPTPDAVPQVAPVAMPVRPPNGVDRSSPMRPRITFPSTGKGDGERGDTPKEGKPPDEGAGA